MKKLCALVAILSVMAVSGCSLGVSTSDSETSSVSEPSHEHTTDFGTCDICGQVQGEGTIDNLTLQFADVANYLLKINNETAGLNLQEDTNQQKYEVYKKVESLWQELYQVIQSMSDECADYEKLSGIKQICAEMLEAGAPVVIDDSDSELEKFYIDSSNSMQKVLGLSQEFMAVSEDF